MAAPAPAPPRPRELRSVLVTGGAGFIGSTLVRRLLETTSARVVVYDSLTYAGLRESLAEVWADPRFRFVQGDVTDGEAAREALREHRPDTLFHLAAESHVDRSIVRPAPFVTTNVVGTATLLDAWREHRDRLEPADAAGLRFVHVSTDEVYGPRLAGPAAREGDPYRPSSPYAASKAAADHLVHAYVTTYGVDAVLTHSTNNYGPRQFPEKLIPLAIERGLAGRPIPLYGDGLQSRDWIHARDHAAALVAVARSGRSGESYHLGAEDVRTNRSVLEAVCEGLDRWAPPGAPHSRLIEMVADRPGHDRRYALDASKARETLGWTPRVAFADGLPETVRWQIDHREWVRAASSRPDADPQSAAKPSNSSG